MHFPFYTDTLIKVISGSWKVIGLTHTPQPITHSLTLSAPANHVNTYSPPQ